MHAENPGTGHSDGCPTDGAPNENNAMKAVVDWINGRAVAYHRRGPATDTIAADWATGKVGMMGTSYNGSLPIAAAATGVAGLEAIVPISPVSDYYEYYRANGMVRGPGGWQGEDADVLVDAVYSRQDETYPRMKCRPLIEQMGRDDRPRHGRPQRVLGRAQPERAGAEHEGRGAARARQQRQQRDDQERDRVL